MKITVLRNLGRGLPDYHEGEVVDAADDLAERLVKLRLAVPFEAESKPTRTKKTERTSESDPAPEAPPAGDDDPDESESAGSDDTSPKKTSRKR